ncbi:mandelate racemase/muconate lactonizing enzyme family protein [Spongiactinospora sp. TRM90649]|uniref:mandelate racemase/muconate lactonizing enzyme family protein n=1 Tax=Spongiactinospora sp. TRM90649 TaxID=3031114 RepID=UPI0023F83CBA|nr:mandelate racemase/muconate lactonizing enzyme family protein [Spongiactinospora sp. TRM90649]MDF5757031.1 mandelate racemase/muconate lactonizing enzyme family protein [Spongiactinospora sp. TRM90649]
MFAVNTTRPTTGAGRISRVETLTLGTPWRDFSFVRISTDEGLTGVGEITHPFRPRETCLLARNMAERHLLGADPFDTEEIWLRMYQGDYMRGGDVGGIVVSGVDQALHDIQGRFLGVPVYRLIGGACRDRVRVYANGWYDGPRDIETFAAKAVKAVGVGFTALKFDPFGPGFRELERSERRLAIDLVAAVREAVGPDIDLFVEGHARFAPHEAGRIVRLLEPFDVGWFEEPLPWTDIEDYHRLRGLTSVPIAGGEHFHNRMEYKPLFDTGAVDIVQPDLCMAGGYTELRKIAAQADTRSMVLAPHNSNSPFCTTATAHLAAATTNFKILETFDALLPPYVFQALDGCLPIRDGHLPLPERPGIGVDLVDEVFEEHPPTYGFWNLFEAGWEKRDRS